MCVCACITVVDDDDDDDDITRKKNKKQIERRKKNYQKKNPTTVVYLVLGVYVYMCVYRTIQKKNFFLFHSGSLMDSDHFFFIYIESFKKMNILEILCENKKKQNTVRDIWVKKKLAN